MSAVTENGYYIIIESYLQFYDNKIKKLVPVCGKANCTHKTMECNAYLPMPDKIGMIEIENICLYQDSLYYVCEDVEGNYILESVSLDGSQRKEVAKMGKTKEGGMVLSMMVHRRYVYYALNFNEQDRKNTLKIYIK